MKTNSEIKLFTIPKTGAFSKDVLIPEKTNSRNVTDLFDDMKSCALDAYFDFAPEQCHACDSVRNPKLQKFYNEKRNAMKKEQDPVERFAFFLVTTRDQASTIANEGLTCEALPTNIDKFLGNPKDGVHLCRRPDILLVSANQRGLKKFGLLICKILISKGFPTIPSTKNDQFPAQLHFDHHFCKIHSTSSEPVTLESLILKSLIFCYEHQEFNIVVRPSQILPIAVIWYELKERFTFHLSMLTKLSLSNEKKFLSRKTNSIQNVSRRISDPMMETNGESSLPTTPIKMNSNPFERIDSSPISSSTAKKLMSPCHRRISETIPISPQKLPPTIPSRSVVPIPHHSLTVLNDPRRKKSQQNHFVCYFNRKSMDSTLVQDQRNKLTDPSLVRENDSQSSYYLIPLTIHEEWKDQHSLRSDDIEIPSLFISVIDCCKVGFDRSSDQNFIDLEQTQNQLIYDQIEFANQLILEKKRLQSMEIRLLANEQRRQKSQETVKTQHKIFTSTSKSTAHYDNGRKLLKNHELPISYTGQLANDLINFFAYEYRQETQSHVKHLMAELMGVFMEKYSYESQAKLEPTDTNDSIDKSNQPGQQSLTMPKLISMSAIPMEIESSTLSQALGDRDERFDYNPSMNLIEMNDQPSKLNPQQENVNTTMTVNSVHEHIHQSMDSLNHRSQSINDHHETNPGSIVDFCTLDKSFLISSNDADERQIVLPNVIVQEQIPSTISSSESILNRMYTHDLGTKQIPMQNNDDLSRSLSPSQRSSTSMKSTSTHSSSSYSVSNSKQGNSSNRREESHKKSYLKRFRLSNRSSSSSRAQSNRNHLSSRTNDRTIFKSNHTNNSSHHFHEQRSTDQDYHQLIPPLMGISNDRNCYFQDLPYTYRLFEERPIASIPPLMSTIPSGNLTTSSYDQKPSGVIERLQKYLQNR